MIKEVTIYLYATPYSEMTASAYDFGGEFGDPDYILLAEPQSVKFEMLDHDTVLAARVGQLDNEIQKVRAEAEERVNDLKDQKQRLMAITYEES